MTDSPSSPTSTARLEWDDLPSGRDYLFNIWAEGLDQRWARSAWAILVDAGLADCNNANERAVVLVRLLTLAAYYHSFCYMAWEEGCVQLEEWASDLDLHPLRIGVFAAVGFPADGEEDDDDLVNRVLDRMVRKELSTVRQVLIRHLRGDSFLFAFLWLSNHREYSGLTGLTDDVLDETLNDDILEKGPAFEWVVTGGSIVYGC